MKNDTMQLDDQLRQNGYFVLNFDQTNPILEGREKLLKKLREITQHPSITLETYHELNLSDEEHTDLQHEMSLFFNSQQMAHQVIEKNIHLFKTLIGIDLDVQASPYLRIARPGKTVDNIGYHRDTFYGGCPEELSTVIPFVDLNEQGTLSVCPKTHFISEDQFEFDQTFLFDKDEFKKSKKHTLGFLYAPKAIKNISEFNMKPIPLKIGQALVFMLSTLHGAIVNHSSISRWSVDIRLKNALSKIDLSARPTYYKPLCRSALFENCLKYYEINGREASSLNLAMS